MIVDEIQTEEMTTDIKTKEEMTTDEIVTDKALIMDKTLTGGEEISDNNRKSKSSKILTEDERIRKKWLRQMRLELRECEEKMNRDRNKCKEKRQTGEKKYGGAEEVHYRNESEHDTLFSELHDRLDEAEAE
jgi:hypothetical protein